MLPLTDYCDTAVPFTAKSLGTMGEVAVMRDLNQSGLQTKKAGTKRGDIQVLSRDGQPLYTLEVKTSQRGADGRYKFNLYRKVGKRVCTDYRHADFLVLLALDDKLIPTMFVIPTRAVNQQMISFANPLSDNKFAQYRL
jgi:hypothetical protein